MSYLKTEQNLRSLLKELASFPRETEWVEFKHNAIRPEDLGEYISALANSAALLGKTHGYLVWGVRDEDHAVVGTNFTPVTAKHKKQELESWLFQKTEPKIDFTFHSFSTEDDLPVVILEIQAANHAPVRFNAVEYIRIGSYKKPLGKYPEKERSLWRSFEKTPWEEQLAAENCTADDVLSLLDYPSYFTLLEVPLPEGRVGILSALEADELIVKSPMGGWDISNLGAILFARELGSFKKLSRKAVRLILYKGFDRLQTVRELGGNKGYAVGFEGLIDYISTLLPSNEEIGKALRKEVPMYPVIAIRELVANAIIHQDFSITGAGPMIEIFESRMEITNPGSPLIDIDRFLDSPPRSRNEAVASLMRRMHICEERGSGIDKVVIQTELYQLPAPLFEEFQDDTKATLFSYRAFKEMDVQEKIQASYLHSVLCYLNKTLMSNGSLRERFGIEVKNRAIVSRVIKQAVVVGKIKPCDKDAGSKAMRYVPWWA